MLKRNKPMVSKKPDIIRLGESDKEMKELNNTKKKVKKPKKEALFVRILNRLLKLKLLKLLELSLGFIKGFSIKLEFFPDEKDKKNM